jgi:hypothetical protein
MLASPLGAGASGSLGYTVHRVGGYGGEPSITAAGTSPTLSSPGELYEASLQNAGTNRSTNAGVTWTHGATNAFSNTGDDCVATDQAGGLYLCNLTLLGPNNAPLNADVYKSVDQGDHWTHSSGVITGTNSNCMPLGSTACNEFGVDRPWVDAYIPGAGTNTSNADVVLMYHDFYGPSHIWVNVSTNGGTSFGPPEDVLANLTPSSGAGDALSLIDTACSTVPTSVNFVKSGPHAGRVYVAWIASDPTAFGSGCNLSQAQAFHNLFVAWSDNITSATPTWTPQLAFDGGVGHDASSPFAAFTLDDKGNPYFAFTMNHWDPSVTTNNSLAATCSTFSGSQIQSHPECEYDMFVVWSQVGPNASDGPTSWDGGGGLVPGSAGAPYQVTDGLTGNHQYPAIAVADPGHVDVAYLRSNEIEPITSSGKYEPGGCSGDTSATGNPGQLPTTPQPCPYDTYAGQSTMLTSPPSTPGLWTVNDITSPTTPFATPMHVGDICNLGIACQYPSSNRDLADFIMQAIDPTTGCAHIVYPNEQTTNQVESADQTGATCFTSLGTPIPETPMALVVIPAGLVAAGALGLITRRRRVGRRSV